MFDTCFDRKSEKKNEQVGRNGSKLIPMNSRVARVNPLDQGTSKNVVLANFGQNLKEKRRFFSLPPPFPLNFPRKSTYKRLAPKSVRLPVLGPVRGLLGVNIMWAVQSN